MKIKNFKMKLDSEKEYWSVLMTIRKICGVRWVDEKGDWTERYLLVKNIDEHTLSIRSYKDKDYYDSRDKDVYPEITYDEFIKLYGGKNEN